MESYDLNFDLTPVEVLVNIGGKPYLLREASGDGAVKYRNACLKSARMNDGKVSGMEGLADAEPLLVSLCLHHIVVGQDGNRSAGTTVALSTVRSWPAKVVSALYKKAREISELDEEDTPEALEKQISDLRERLTRLRAGKTEDPAKNGHSVTTASSASATS